MHDTCQQPVSLHRIPHLSGEIISHTSLRGLAASLVVAYHVYLATGRASMESITGLVIHGYLFVDMFFILSGYIICAKYGNHFNSSLTSAKFFTFMAQRFARIYPNFLFWMLVSTAFFLLERFRIGDKLPQGFAESFLLHILMLQSILDVPVKVNIPLWSISVEVISYALFPLIAGALIRKPISGTILSAVALMGAALVLTEVYGTVDVVVGGGSVLRGVVAFVAGCTLALHHCRITQLSDAWLSTLQFAAASLTVMSVHFGLEILALPAFAALILLTSVNRGIFYSIMRIPFFHTIGILSFSIYLSHTLAIKIAIMITYKFVEEITQNSTTNPLTFFMLIAALSALLTVFFAWVSFNLVEQPGQRWLQRRLFALRETKNNQKA